MAKKTKIEKGAIQKSGKEVKQRKLVAIEKDERPISKPQQEADATDQETEEVLGNVDSDVESAPVANDEQEGTGDSDDDVVVMSGREAASCGSNAVSVFRPIGVQYRQ